MTNVRETRWVQPLLVAEPPDVDGRSRRIINRSRVGSSIAAGSTVRHNAARCGPRRKFAKSLGVSSISGLQELQTCVIVKESLRGHRQTMPTISRMSGRIAFIRRHRVIKEVSMNTFPRRPVRFVGGLTLCLLGLAGCGAASSPEKVFTDWSTAVKSGNFRGAWECLAPQARGTVLQIMVLDADLLSSANAAAKTSFGQVFEKYGLNPQDPGFAKNRLNSADPAGLAADLDNVFRQYTSELGKLPGSRYAKLNAIWTASAQSSLGPSKKEGTRATAAIQGQIPHTPEKTTLQAVFEKVNSQWLFAELEPAAGGAAMGGGASGMPGAQAGAMPGMPGANMPGGNMPPAGAPGGQPALAGGGNAPTPGGGLLAMNPSGGPPGASPPAGFDPKTMPTRPGADPGQPANPGGAAPAGAPPAGIDPKTMPARPGGEPGQPGNPGAGLPQLMPAKPDDGRPPAGADPKNMPARPGGPALGGPPAGAPGAGADPNGVPARPGNPAGAGALPNANGGDGAPGIARAGGAGGNAAGGGQNNQYKQGSFEHTVTEFTSKVAAGDYTGMDYLVSSKAKGLLAEIRDDEVGDEKKDELKSTFASAAPQDNTRKNKGSAVEIYVKGKLGHMIQLSVGKEEGVFKIKEMKIHEPGASKKR